MSANIHLIVTEDITMCYISSV